MRHCTTDGYWPEHPGFTSQGARRHAPLVWREYALQHHLERLPTFIPWGDEFTTRTRIGDYPKAPVLTVVTRCRGGHLHTVIHLSTEPYPRP